MTGFASRLSNCRSHKTGVLRALRLQFSEVDSAGGQSAALRARLEPLGMRRELLQYRLAELQHQTAEATDEGRVHQHILLRTTAQRRSQGCIARKHGGLSDDGSSRLQAPRAMEPFPDFWLFHF